MPAYRAKGLGLLTHIGARCFLLGAPLYLILRTGLHSLGALLYLLTSAGMQGTGAT